MSAQGLVRRAEELAAILDVHERVGLAESELLAAVRLAGEVRRLVDAAGVVLAGEVECRSPRGDDASLARRAGERSAAALVAVEAGLDITEAAAWCRVGSATARRCTLQGVPLPLDHAELSHALASGALGVEAASRVLSTLERVDKVASPEVVAQLERTLVAVIPGLSARETRRRCQGIVDRVDPDGAEPRDEELRARSGVRIVQEASGLTRWIVTMHPEAAGMLTAALDARTAPRRAPRFDASSSVEAVDEPDGRRSLAQRRLDALVELARESLARDDGHVAGAPVTMVVTIGLEALQSGIGTAAVSGIDAPIPASTARRLAADAGVIPMVLGGPSEVLDQGRMVRLATAAQRRALDLRDGGCLWPGCTAPPGWCEVAHIVPWFDGGTTDLHNLMLLCPFHHRRFDHDGWELTEAAGVRWLIPPVHVDAAQRPRRAGARERAA